MISPSDDTQESIESLFRCLRNVTSALNAVNDCLRVEGARMTLVNDRVNGLMERTRNLEQHLERILAPEAAATSPSVPLLADYVPIDLLESRREDDIKYDAWEAYLADTTDDCDWGSFKAGYLAGRKRDG